MNSEILCEKCHHILAQPTVLPCCFASLCLNCTKRTVTKDTKPADKLYYKCTFCKKDHQTYSSTKLNVFLARYIEFCHKQGKFQIVPCGNCGREVSSLETIGCRECGTNYFCSDCDRAAHCIEDNRLHERVVLMDHLKSYNGSLNKSMFCSIHPKEKSDFICLKDLDVLCKLCVPGHNRACHDSKIVPLEYKIKEFLYNSFRKSHAELAGQLSAKIGQVNDCKNAIDGDYSRLKQRLQEFNKSSESIMTSIGNQFNEIRELIDAKEREVKGNIEPVLNKIKTSLNQEIKTFESMNLKTENLIDIVEFAISYPNSFFCEGAKYLVNRLNKLTTMFGKIEPTKPYSIGTFNLANLDSCKSAISQITLTDMVESPFSPLLSPISSPIPSPTKFFKGSIYSTIKEETPNKVDRVKKNLFGSTSTESTPLMDASKTKTLHVKTKSNVEAQPKFLSKLRSEKHSIDMRSAANLSLAQSLTKSLTKLEASNCTVGKSSPGSEKKEKINLITEPSTPSKFVKSVSQSATVSIINSRKPSKSPTNHYKTLKAWAEHARTPTNVLEGYRSLGLQPHSREGSIPMLNESVLRQIGDIENNYLIKRKLKVLQTATTIHVEWLHPHENNSVIYQVEYGIGSKLHNVEQFRVAFKGPGDSYTITDLMPRTKYRLRVCPIVLSNEEDEEEELSGNKVEIFGQWSDVINVTTKDLQAVDPSSAGLYTTVNVQGKDNIIEFEKSGRAVAKNEYEFGKTMWEIKLPQQLAHQAPTDSNSFIKIGVTNKVGKAYSITGSLINYGLHEGAMVIKVALDMDNRVMVVYTSNNKNGEIFNNLPVGPLYPAFQNKTSKDTNFPLKLTIRFDLPYPTNELRDTKETKDTDY